MGGWIRSAAVAFAGFAGCLALAAPGRPASAATILDLQPFAQTTTAAAAGGGKATLINLNPRINVWYVLALQRDGASSPAYFHLQNPAPLHQTLLLDGRSGRGLLVRTDHGEEACELWPERGARPLEEARRSGASYAPLCGGRLYLRNPTAGYRSGRELVADFLRDHVWGGERLVGVVKQTVQRDAYLERSTAPPMPGRDAPAATAGGPLPASVDAAEQGSRPVPAGLGIELELPVPGRIDFGRWYPAEAAAGVYGGVMQPGLVPAQLLATYPARVRRLDAVEAGANVYLVAFDLAQFGLGYEIGTDHPRVGWSERALPQVRDAGLAGPDGFDTITPLVATGIVDPVHLGRTVAAFAGGFKRAHGAFRYGELALKNRGSHYGWMESGVLFSTLEPGLATLLVRDSGAVEMLTWPGGGDPARLRGIEHARQNGVPLIEPDRISGEPIPGALVGNWSAGNWSGSVDGEQRTVRSGVCLQESAAGRFLVYGYFSSVTPSAMTRVFQAYRCRYAMQLDMNALEHTYLALYRVEGAEVAVQHLVRGMEEVDRRVAGRSVPRFVGYPDSRDFFYLVRRQEDEP